MRRLLALSTVLVLSACSGADDAPPAEEAAPQAAAAPSEAPVDATIAAIAERYATTEAAMADGFMRDPTGACVTAEMVGLPATDGAMGVHYLHPARLGLIPESMPVDGTDGVIDFAEPEVLVYEPQADGTERLVAVEYLVFQDAWAAAGNTAPPSLMGEEFVSMIDDPATEMDESHGLAAHYELHAWVPRDNPTGLFAEFNPNVTCQHAPAPSMPMEMD